MRWKQRLQLWKHSSTTKNKSDADWTAWPYSKEKPGPGVSPHCVWGWAPWCPCFSVGIQLHCSSKPCSVQSVFINHCTSSSCKLTSRKRVPRAVFALYSTKHCALASGLRRTQSHASNLSTNWTHAKHMLGWYRMRQSLFKYCLSGIKINYPSSTCQ